MSMNEAMARRKSSDMAVQYDQRDLSIRTSLVSGAGERQTLLTPTRHRRSRGASFRQLEEDLGPMTWEAFTAMVGSAANLMATSMGTGMLALPIAVYYSGAVTGTVLIIAMAILSDISLVFLVNAAQQSGTTDLQGLGRYYYGPNGEMMVNTSLVALLLCAALSILIAIADLLTPIWQQSLQTDNYDQWYCQKWFVMCLCCALIYPISIPSNLAPLKWSSFGAVMSIFLVFVFMCIRFVQHGVAKDSPIELFVDSPLAALALPIQGLAYASQFNVVGLYIELGPHKKRMKSVIHYSCAFTCVIYACFGLLGYLYFGAETGKYSMILDGFHNDTLMLVAGAMISLTNILKMPLIILPFRNTVNQILFGKTDISLLMSAFETVFLLILVYFLAVQVGDLALALELSGPTVGVFVCFILPGILAYKSDKEKLSKLLPPYAYDEESFSRTQISALVVAMVGALMGLASCVGLAFQESDDHHHHHHSHNATIT